MSHAKLPLPLQLWLLVILTGCPGPTKQPTDVADTSAFATEVDAAKVPDTLVDHDDAVPLADMEAIDVGVDAAVVDIPKPAELPLACPDDVTVAALLPGDPAMPAACTSWIRMGASTQGERADGKIAIYSAATGERRVYGADGALLSVDQGVPLAESLTPLGTGYYETDGPKVKHYDGEGKLLWTTKIPDVPSQPQACGGFFDWVFGVSATALSPAGRFGVSGHREASIELTGDCAPDIWAIGGYAVLDQNGAFLLNQSMVTIFAIAPKVWTVWAVEDGLMFRSGAANMPSYCHLPDSALEPSCLVGYPSQSWNDQNGRHVWANGDIQICDNFFLSNDPGAPAVGRMRPGSTPGGTLIWAVSGACEAAGILSDDSVVGFGNVAGPPTSEGYPTFGERTWFRANGDGTQYSRLAFPKKYVPTMFKKSVTGDMLLSGYVENADGSKTPWFGHSPLDPCQPLACKLY
jgi:hypothetical protein